MKGCHENACPCILWEYFTKPHAVKTGRPSICDACHRKGLLTSKHTGGAPRMWGAWPGLLQLPPESTGESMQMESDSRHCRHSEPFLSIRIIMIYSKILNSSCIRIKKVQTSSRPLKDKFSQLCYVNLFLHTTVLNKWLSNNIKSYKVCKPRKIKAFPKTQGKNQEYFQMFLGCCCFSLCLFPHMAFFYVFSSSV